MCTRGCAALAAAVVSCATSAQSFNIDCGVALGTPSTSFGGAAGQPGVWNQFAGNTDEPLALVDVSGGATGVTMALSLPAGPGFTDHPDVTGETGSLLEDYIDLRSISTQMTFSGLAAGEYLLYVYAWAPDSPFFSTSVWLDPEEAVVVGGDWPGELTAGVTHAAFQFEITGAEDLTVNMFGFTKGTLNGVQIVQIPAPGSGALLALAGAASARRRRSHNHPAS